ncbi:MAG: alpha/beta fold hydrolase [Candidatus Aminicenantes bacterium]|nr:alpha/beta fold hydrolase [Candidatus Aminicenantes bacterium]
MINLIIVILAISSLNPQPVFSQESSFPERKKLEGKEVGSYVMKPGTFQSYSADFGRILVPENRNKKNSRIIHLIFIRICALEDNSAEPVFLLNGGPGKSNIRGLLSPVFFTHNDLVIVGYRGIDTSVRLESTKVSEAMTIENPLSPLGMQHISRIIKREFDRFKRNGVDIDGYTVLEVVDDIDLIRSALGYPKINLFSSSYGTILAYLYCQRYPEHANRNLMVGASNISRHLVRDPGVIDKVFNAYGRLWENDPQASERTPDIIKTIRKVLKTLPRYWNGIRIDADKIRICTYWQLYETETAAKIFDAFVAAENGDYSGLALLSYSYDKEIPDWDLLCDYFSKAISCGLDTTRELAENMDPPESIIGSPSCKLILGSSSQGAWPIKPIPLRYRTIDSCHVETLIVMGNLDPSGPLDYVKEMMPYFKRGRLVVLSEMGHMDPANLQPKAFNHLGELFYSSGEVDTSKFVYNKMSFTPGETFQSLAKEVFKDKIKK